MGTEDGIDLGIEGITNAVLVGQGSFGTVYRATQAAYGRTVAVKVLSAPMVDEQSRKAFDRECRALGTISDHPGIVTLYAAGISAAERPYLIMEFLSGGSLADALASGPLPWERAIVIGIKIAAALATAHAAGVLHRDIKPENILLSAYNEPELADFGVAKVQGGTSTSMGTITGSVAYAAPEVLSGMPATEASDVWGLASTIATLLAGVSPFHHDGEQSLHPLLMRIISGEPNDLRQLGVPEDVYQVILAALVKNSWERTPSAVAFGESLQEVQRGRGLPVTPMTVRLSSATAAVTPPHPATAPGSSGPGALQPQGEMDPGRPSPLDAPSATGPVVTAGEESATRLRGEPFAPTAPGAVVRAHATPDAPPGLSPVSGGGGAPGHVDPALSPSGHGGAGRFQDRRKWVVAGAAAVVVVVLAVVLLTVPGKSHRAQTVSTGVPVTTVGPSSSTPSSTTTTTAAPVRPLFADDFTNPASGWAPDPSQDGDGSASYKPDGYQVSVITTMPALNTFSLASPYKPRLMSLSANVTATLTGAPADGVGVRCDQGGRVGLRYTFEIHGDGSWVIFKTDTVATALLQGQSPTVINTGAGTNLITGICTNVGTDATKLTMLVNGVTLGTTTDTHPNQVPWHVALIVHRSSPTVATEARFNSFQEVVAGG